MSSNPILRPLFYEGQILNADDLTATVEYAHDQLARHDRCLHTWGVACGMGLTFASVSNSSGTFATSVTVASGVANDGLGRELVLTQSQVLDPADFISAKVYDQSNPNGWYAVYIQAYDDTPTSQPSLAGACAGANLATRQGEDVQFNFYPPFPQNNSTAPYSDIAADASPDAPGNVPAWNILIGFVQWNDEQSCFSAAQNYNGDTPPIYRRLAGVQAARVEAIDGSLTLQTSANPATRLLVVTQEAVGTTAGTLTFGTDNGNGGVNNLLQVDDQGNLSIKGNFTTAAPLQQGKVGIQSGIATDGMTLPLPSGVTDASVSAGSVLLHIQLTPIVPDISSGNNLWTGSSAVTINAVTPQACYVDRNRRARCSLLYQLSSLGTSSKLLPGMCHYTIMAVPAAGGTSS